MDFVKNNRSRLFARSRDLKNFIAVLEFYKDTELDEIDGDENLRTVIDNGFISAINATLDISYMILREEGFGETENYQERMEWLVEAEVLEPDFAERFALLSDFWDCMLNHYSIMEPEDTFNHLESIEDYQLFSDSVEDYLGHLKQKIESGDTGEQYFLNGEPDEEDGQELDEESQVLEEESADAQEEEALAEPACAEDADECIDEADDPGCIEEHEDECTEQYPDESDGEPEYADVDGREPHE